MKKSQILASTVLASTLSLAGITTPLVYAVEGDTSAGIVEEVTTKDFRDRVVDLLNSLEFEPSDADDARFTKLEADAAYGAADSEAMVKFDKIIAAWANTDQLSGRPAKALEVLFKYNIVNETQKTIAELYTLSQESDDAYSAGVGTLELDDVAALRRYADLERVQTAIDNNPAVAATLAAANVDLEDESTWEDEDDDFSSLLAIYIVDDIMNNYTYGEGEFAASLQELADYLDVRDDVVTSAAAQTELAEIQAGEHEDSAAYAYWQAFNELVAALGDSDLTEEEQDAVLEQFKEAAINAGAYVAEEQPEQPKPDQPDPEQPEKPTPEQPEEKPTPEQPSDSEKEPKPTQPDNSDRPSNIVITEVVSGDTSDDKIASPVAAPNTGIVSHTQEVTTSAQSNQTVAIVASILALASATVALITRRCRKEA